MPVTNYVWDPVSDNVLLEADENDVRQAVYTQEPDTFGNLISQRRDDETSWYSVDGRGNRSRLPGKRFAA